MGASKEQNIRLAPFGKQHIDAMVGWINDKEIAELIDRSPSPASVDDCRKWYDDVRHDKTKVLFAIVDGPGRHIGNGGLFDWHQRANKAKLWMYIGEKDCWGKGCGRKALCQLIEYGFNTLQLHRIYLYIVAHNERARRLYESVGFVREGLAREDAFVGGRYIDTISYGLLSGDYRP